MVASVLALSFIFLGFLPVFLLIVGIDDSCPVGQSANK